MKIKVFLMLFLFVLNVSAFADSNLNLDRIDNNFIKRHTLDNGMTVITKKIAQSELVSISLLVKTGSATEGKFLGSGITHFIEHMLFKGTIERKVGSITKEIQAHGGDMGAYTTRDYTGYTITILKENVAKALEILADAGFNSQFDTIEVEKEREVIINEIRLHNDRPDSHIYNLLMSSVYTKHPYRHPIIGYLPLFKEITRDDLISYYKLMYIPNNMVLAIAGDFNEEKLMSLIKENFKEASIKPFVLRDSIIEPQQVAIRKVEEDYPTDLSRMYMGFRATGVANQDMFALDCLSAILGQGESSRLYNSIYKNKRLVYSIDSFNMTLLEDGVFAIYCILNNDKIEDTQDGILEEIERIKKQGIKKEELEKTKRLVMSSYVFGLETLDSTARDLAVSEILTSDFDFSKKYVEAIKKVTLKDIKYVANKYLNKESLSIVTLNPISETKKETEGKKQETQAIQKIVLDNGLTCLFRKDSKLPIVSIKAIFLGGVRAEDEGTNGLSNLVSRMLLKGTDRFTSQEIAEKIESLGANIEPFSGANSFGLSLDMLSDDIEAGLNILADIITNPAFPELELKQEKDLILGEIREEDDDVFKLSFKALKKTLFANHPYRFSYRGTKESIENISRQDVIEFYRNFCIPSNMILAVFGDIDKAKAETLIKNKFGNLKNKKMPVILLSQAFPDSVQEVKIEVPREQTIVVFGFPGVKIADSSRYSFEVLDSILTSFGGRLFNKIRDNLGKAYTLGGASVPGIEQGFYYVYAATSFEDLESVREIVKNEILNIQTENVEDIELDRQKVYLCSNKMQALETNSSLALESGLDELYDLGFDNYKLYEQKIKEVTKEDIVGIAKQYLNLDKMVVIIAYPKEKQATEEE